MILQINCGTRWIFNFKKEDLREVNIQVDIEKEIKLIIDKKTNEQLNQFSNIHFNKIKKNIKIYEL